MPVPTGSPDRNHGGACVLAPLRQRAAEIALRRTPFGLVPGFIKALSRGVRLDASGPEATAPAPCSDRRSGVASRHRPAVRLVEVRRVLPGATAFRGGDHAGVGVGAQPAWFKPRAHHYTVPLFHPCAGLAPPGGQLGWGCPDSGPRRWRWPCPRVAGREPRCRTRTRDGVVLYRVTRLRVVGDTVVTRPCFARISIPVSY